MTAFVGAACCRLLFLIFLAVGNVTSVRPPNQHSPGGIGHVGESPWLNSSQTRSVPMTATHSLVEQIDLEGKFHDRAACGMKDGSRDAPNVNSPREWKQLLQLSVIFYSLFFSFFALTWVVLRRSAAAFQSLKSVAQLYTRQPATSVMVVAVLSGVADCMAQTVPAYWGTSMVKRGFWDWRCTLVVASASALVQGCWLATAYELIDARLSATPASSTLSAAMQRMVKQQLLFLCLCLPAVVFGLAMLAGLMYRSLLEAQDRCGAAALAALPRNAAMQHRAFSGRQVRSSTSFSCSVGSPAFAPPGM